MTFTGRFGPSNGDHRAISQAAAKLPKTFVASGHIDQRREKEAGEVPSKEYSPQLFRHATYINDR
jgi:hypothetical protein